MTQFHLCHGSRRERHWQLGHWPDDFTSMTRTHFNCSGHIIRRTHSALEHWLGTLMYCPQVQEIEWYTIEMCERLPHGHSESALVIDRRYAVLNGVVIRR